MEKKGNTAPIYSVSLMEWWPSMQEMVENEKKTIFNGASHSGHFYSNILTEVSPMSPVTVH